MVVKCMRWRECCERRERENLEHFVEGRFMRISAIRKDLFTWLDARLESQLG
jgi:hypothetical protein